MFASVGDWLLGMQPTRLSSQLRKKKKRQNQEKTEQQKQNKNTTGVGFSLFSLGLLATGRGQKGRSGNRELCTACELGGNSLLGHSKAAQLYSRVIRIYRIENRSWGITCFALNGRCLSHTWISRSLALRKYRKQVT